MQLYSSPLQDTPVSISHKKAKNTYTAVDLAKFLCAFLVVGVHTKPFYDIHYSLGFFFENVVARLAVPFFFISSGYFFAAKLVRIPDNEDARPHLYGFIKRILTLYLLWTVIYLPYNLYNDYKTYGSMGTAILMYPKKLFVIGSHFQLWYLPSLIYSTAIVYFFIRKKNDLGLFITSGILLVLGLLGDSYFGLLPENTLIHSIYRWYITEFRSTRTGIFFGVPFIAAGAFLARHPQWLQVRNAAKLTLVFALLYIAETLLISYYHLAEDHNMYVFLLPLSISIFILLLRVQVPAVQNFTVEMRSLSIGIYCAHGIFLMVCYRIFEKLHLDVNQHAILYFVFISVCSFFFTLALLKSNIKLLQKLVS